MQITFGSRYVFKQPLGKQFTEEVAFPFVKSHQNIRASYSKDGFGVISCPDSEDPKVDAFLKTHKITDFEKTSTSIRTLLEPVFARMDEDAEGIALTLKSDQGVAHNTRIYVAKPHLNRHEMEHRRTEPETTFTFNPALSKEIAFGVLQSFVLEQRKNGADISAGWGGNQTISCSDDLVETVEAFLAEQGLIQYEKAHFVPEEVSAKDKEFEIIVKKGYGSGGTRLVFNGEFKVIDGVQVYSQYSSSEINTENFTDEIDRFRGLQIGADLQGLLAELTRSEEVIQIKKDTPDYQKSSYKSLY